MATANDDPHLGAGPSEDSEIVQDDSESGSLLSDDSVLPDYERDDNEKESAKTLYEACAKNDPASLRRILERGVTKEEAMELDINGKVMKDSFSIESLEQSDCHNTKTYFYKKKTIYTGKPTVYFYVVPIRMD